MKAIKCLIISVCLSGGLSACDDFFDTVPNDQLSPATFWKTEADVINAVTACYEDWNNPATGSSDVFFADCMSDIAYSFTGSSSYKNVSNGSLSSTSTVGYYSYTTIRRCNLVLENAGHPLLVFLFAVYPKVYWNASRRETTKSRSIFQKIAQAAG